MLPNVPQRPRRSLNAPEGASTLQNVPQFTSKSNAPWSVEAPSGTLRHVGERFEKEF
jgi:hypothetical protein